MISWWDALIVAGAQGSACRILLTEDVQARMSFGEVRVINPFARADRSPEILKEPDLRTP